MTRAVPGGSRPPAPRARAGVRDWLLLALPLLLAAVVHRRALGAFFGTDDFVRLEEAVGILPSTPTLWRLVSEVLYLKLMLRFFGPEPLPFHIVSLALHLVNTAFVFRLGRKAGLSAGAACLAASVFGAFPLSYTVLLSAVNINDIMALTFVFLALLALEVATLARIGLAVACFVIALLSKEAVLFVPFAAVLLPLPGERIAGTARRLMPLLVAGVVFAALYLTFRTHGLGTGGPAYAAGFGIPLFFNLMTYAHWCVDLVRTVPDAHGGIDVSAWRVGLWPLAAFALAAALPSLRRGAILFGCAWWLLALAPVLPLLAHTYGHYLYVPIAGFAIAGAATVESALAGIAWLVKRRPARASGSAIVAGAFALLAVGYAVRSDALLERRATARLGASQFALDPFTRKMEIAQHAVDTFRGQIDRDRDTVVVFTPQGIGMAVSAKSGRTLNEVPAGAFYYDVTEAVLGGGRALRLFEPRVDSVVFVGRWEPIYRDHTLFTEANAGRLQLMGRGPRSHSRYASLLIANGFNDQAREYLAEVVGVYPGDRLIRLLYAVSLSGTGALDSSRAQARVVIESAPRDTITAAALRLISILDAKK